MQLSRSLLAIISVSTSLAAPVDNRLEDIQCRCLSFSADTRPTVCTYMESHTLDWYTANALASDYDIKINFASQNTVQNVLSIHKPLPSSLLQSISNGAVMSMDSVDFTQRENKIVCGFGDEVKHLSSHDRSLEPECHFVGYVGAAFMLLLALYVLAEFVWSRLFAQGSIKLVGEEKALKAEHTASLEAQNAFDEAAAPLDIGWI